MPISEVFEADIGLGGVLALLWFRRRLPDYATKFIEMILMVRGCIWLVLHRFLLMFCNASYALYIDRGGGFA